MRKRLYTAEELRALLSRAWRGRSHAALGELLGLSAGFVGMVLKGSREPSKAFLEAVGFERVVLYRRSR